MHIVMLALFLLPEATPPAAPLPADVPLASQVATYGYVAAPPCMAPWMYSAHWRRYPLPASYFCRPFDYHYQFDYFWHARVRIIPACPPAVVDGGAASNAASIETAEVPLPPARIGATKAAERH